MEFLYYGKGNVSGIFEVCNTFHRLEKQDKSLTVHFMEFKKSYEELNMLLPFSTDIKVQQTQSEHMVVICFLVSPPSEFDTAKSHILSSLDISSPFNRLLRTEIGLKINACWSMERCFPTRLPPECRLEKDAPIGVLVGRNGGHQKISSKKVVGGRVFQGGGGFCEAS